MPRKRKAFLGRKNSQVRAAPGFFTASLEQENPETDFSFSPFLSVLLPFVTGVKEHRLVEWILEISGCVHILEVNIKVLKPLGKIIAIIRLWMSLVLVYYYLMGNDCLSSFGIWGKVTSESPMTLSVKWS